MPLTYGFIGAGEITTAIVEGLSTGDAPEIALSPRGRQIGRALADRFPNVRVCADNQEVLERADIIVLAVRPQLADQVLGELTFQPRQVVISALTGVRLEHLRELCAPAERVARVIPLPPAAQRQSLTVLFPDEPAARALFDRVGSVLVPAAEESLDTFQTATATFAAHLDYLTTIADWMAEQGVDAEMATAYTRHVFGQLSRTLLQHTGSLGELTARHMTPGGLNEQLLADMRAAAVPATVRRALDRILLRLRG